MTGSEFLSDGALPCGPCQRSHAYAVKSTPAVAAPEPECTYDDPDVIAEGPKGRIARLESEVAELRAYIQTTNDVLAKCTCGAARSLNLLSSSSNTNATSPSDRDSSPAASAPSISSPTKQPGTFSETPTTALLFSSVPPISSFLLPPSPWDTRKPPPLYLLDPLAPFVPGSPGTFDISTTVWPLNIPPPPVLFHLVETFFSSVPLASRLLHKPTFMLNIRQVPTSPDFPHVALLHAICGLAALYSPIINETRRDSSKDSGPAGSFNSGIVIRPDASEGVQGERYFPKNVEDVMDIGEDGFGASHIRWAAASVRVSLGRGDRLFQLLQTTLICTWYAYSTGMTIGTYTWIGSAIKLATSLGVNVANGFEPLSRLPPMMLSLLGLPRSHTEAETVRNVFWIAYGMERIYCGGTVWPLTMNDEDISQILPCRLADFNAGTYVPTQTRQCIFSENMILTHQPLMTDAWTLYIKATILISKVRSFNGRYRIKKVFSAQGLGGEAASFIGGSPTESQDFMILDQTISSFINGMPKAFREPVGTTVDPVLYMAHLLPFVAMIQLHDPHAKPELLNDPSAAQLLFATRGILDLIYKVCATSFDLLFLDHSCSFCWFVAGASIIRFLKVRMHQKDEGEVARLTQELGAVKFMLNNLGDRTVIGIRQIKLLEEIYVIEIGSGGPFTGAEPSLSDLIQREPSPSDGLSVLEDSGISFITAVLHS
ncbi:hypothetical protein M407DRAFT_27692 [Tulasnella calospora MUT 4182]|uniref:Xylanolytic transcriptional activator regulatory domain-containing protein n=1 Tax=Tulasnella calospora MUT 4182 TaxID=1051891 RepID=A0A0C3KN97_9AGAM|nr:hypothetical protein M407DRAFT_27692 [Tulasnella calospora MUT 4182]